MEILIDKRIKYTEIKKKSVLIDILLLSLNSERVGSYIIDTLLVIDNESIFESKISPISCLVVNELTSDRVCFGRSDKLSPEVCNFKHCS